MNVGSDVEPTFIFLAYYCAILVFSLFYRNFTELFEEFRKLESSFTSASTCCFVTFLYLQSSVFLECSNLCVDLFY